jgi:peptidoglycan/LPS O-acetylase OafA/YrhL
MRWTSRLGRTLYALGIGLTLIAVFALGGYGDEEGRLVALAGTALLILGLVHDGAASLKRSRSG